VGARRKFILLDFFRHAFDGSGADNFVSCHAPCPVHAWHSPACVLSACCGDACTV
jgi:hypothetical protein